MALRTAIALVALLLLPACQTTAPEAPSAQAATAPGSRVALASADPADFEQILDRSAPERKVEAEFYLPKTGSNPYPAVIIAHGDEGIGEREHMYAYELTEAGFAVLIPDSFAPRGGDGETVSLASQLADVSAGFRHLAGDARINSRRVGIMGFSRGGTVAYLAAHTPFVRAMTGDGAAFAAHMPFYPFCDWRIEKYQAAGAAVIMMVADKDDWAPTEACLPVQRALTEAGNEVAWKRYAGTHHAFDRPPVGVRAMPEAKRVMGCTSMIDARGRTTLNGKGMKPGSVALGRDYAAYRRTMMERCGAKGAHVGSPVDYRGDAARDVVGFFTHALKRGT